MLYTFKMYIRYKNISKYDVSYLSNTVRKSHIEWEREGTRGKMYNERWRLYLDRRHNLCVWDTLCWVYGCGIYDDGTYLLIFPRQGRKWCQKEITLLWWMSKRFRCLYTHHTFINLLYVDMKWNVHIFCTRILFTMRH